MSSNDNDYLWDGAGDDEEILAIEKRVADLSLQTRKPRSGRRRAWVPALLFSVLVSLVGFHTLQPTQVPERFIGLFADSSEDLDHDDSVAIEYTVTGETNRTSAVVEILRRRGATIDYWRDGSIIASIDELNPARAEDEALALVKVGRVLFGTVDEQPGPPAARSKMPSTMYGPMEFSNVRIAEGSESTKQLIMIASVNTEHADNVARYLEENSDKRIVAVVDETVTTTVVRRGPGQSVYLIMREPTPDKIESLKGALETRTLPEGVEIEVANVTVVAQDPPTGAVLGARALLALLLGLALFVPMLVFERAARPVDPDVAPLRTTSRRSFARRWAVTALVALAPMAVALISQRLGVSSPTMNVFPFVAGISLVYVLSCIPGPVRKLMSGHWRAVGHIVGGAALVAVAVSMALSFGEGMPAGFDVSNLVIGWRLGWLLVTGAVFVGIAVLGTRFGAINGFVAMVAGAAIPSLVQLVSPMTLIFYPQFTTSLAKLFGYLFAASVVVMTTALVLRWRIRVGGEFRRLAVGWTAPMVILFIIAAVHVLTRQSGVSPFDISIWWLMPVLAIPIIAWHLRAKTASGPRVVNGDSAAAPVRRLVAGVLAFGYVALLVALPAVGIAGIYEGGSLMAPSSLMLALLTAIGLDVAAEIRSGWRNSGLVRVARIDDARSIDSVADALARVGIDCHLRNQYVRHLTGPLGAFAPIEVMVPAHRADEAQTVVLGQL